MKCSLIAHVLSSRVLPRPTTSAPVGRRIDEVAARLSAPRFGVRAAFGLCPEPRSAAAFRLSPRPITLGASRASSLELKNATRVKNVGRVGEGGDYDTHKILMVCEGRDEGLLNLANRGPGRMRKT